MDCIPYINDLQIEINILNDIKENSECDLAKINKKIQDKEFLIQRCKENLSKLSNNHIEYRLYLNLLNGLKPSQAVEKVAQENYLNDIKPNSVAWIWQYYKNLQKIINN